MKVGAKLALGGALAVLPLVGGLAYTVAQVESLARIGAVTTQRRHQVAQLTLQVVRGLELSEEYRSKLAVTGDPGYHEKGREIDARLSGWIDELGAIELSAAEREATADLARAWDQERGATRTASDGLAGTRQAVNARLEVHREALAAHARWAETRANDTARVATAVGLAAIAVSLIVISLLIRAIQRPLRQLIRGTRAVAGGNFEYRARPLARDELGEVTEAFNHMVDALGELERLKAELVSRVSHELRTPLVAMIETNRLLLDEIPGPINARQRRMLELHAGAAERLSAMIQDLLELSTMEAGTLDRRPADLVPLTREVIEQLAPLASDRRVTVDLGFSVESAVVRCDGRRYQQVVQNLVDNALAHSPPGGMVHVGLSIGGGDTLPEGLADDDDDKPWAVLRVDDEGPGVPPADRERIFEKFVQGAEARQGVGLGLAICRQIVAAHGGHIAVHHSALGGASFVATFPVAREDR